MLRCVGWPRLSTLTFQPLLNKAKSMFSYDAKCEDLARHFLADADDMDKRAAQLAQHIQESVEKWFIAVEDDDAPEMAVRHV